MKKLNCGLFGKLPAHGDFIERGLSGQFIELWDDWLQRMLAESRSQLGNHWLDLYLNCPIWRFALGHGVINSDCWVGVLVPSVDSVGRYFPLTLAAPVNGHTDPFQFLANEHELFCQLESIALRALQEGCDADAVWQQLKTCEPSTVNHTLVSQLEEKSRTVIARQEGKRAPGSGLLYCMARMYLNSASFWHCSTDETSEFITPGLPQNEHFLFMLSGEPVM